MQDSRNSAKTTLAAPIDCKERFYDNVSIEKKIGGKLELDLRIL